MDHRETDLPRNCRRPRAFGRQAPAGRLGRAAGADRGGRFGLAGRRRRDLNAGRCRRRAGGMVDRARQRSVPGSAVLSRRRLLLGLACQPSPHGHRGRARRANPHARAWPTGSRPNIRFRPRSTTRLSAYRFLRQQGIAASHIAVGGDSAGGGLTVALINRLRDLHEEPPACAWLCSPWTDLTMSGATLTTKDAVDPLIHKGYLEELAAAYVPAGMDRKDPRVSPLLFRSRRISAHAHSGRLGGNTAC